MSRLSVMGLGLNDVRRECGLPLDWRLLTPKVKRERKPRRKHSRFGSVHCPICAPCRCSKAP